MIKLLSIFSKFPWLFPTLIFTILILGAARMHPLWGDEAETALFARNILKYGVPKGWDGVNIMGINNAVVLDANLINHTSPWAQYYVAAAGMALFGDSSMGARLLSIFMALLTIPIIFLVTKRIGGDTNMATLATVLASLNVQYILFAYQARYYMLTCLTGLIFFYAAHQLMQYRFKYALLFVVGAVLFFYANYVSFLAFYLAIFMSLNLNWVFTKVKDKDVFRWNTRFVILSLIVGTLTAPWVFYFQPFASRGAVVSYAWEDFLSVFGTYFFQGMNFFNYAEVFPFLFYIIFLVIVVIRVIKRQPVSRLLLFFFVPVLYFLLMTYFTTITWTDTMFINTRYTTVIIPFWLILAAYLLYRIYEMHKFIGVMMTLVFLFSNIFTFHAPQSFLWKLMGEIISPYETPDEAVVKYLKTHAKDGDTAWVNLDRDHEPLIFHLKDKIRFVNRVSLINTRIFPKNRGIIPRYIYDFRDNPDWIILYSKRGIDDTFLTFDMRPLPSEVNLARDYEEIVLPVFFSDMTRPEMELRSFTKIVPVSSDQIFIYKKK